MEQNPYDAQGLENVLEAMKDLKIFDANDPVQVNNKRRSAARQQKEAEDVLKKLLSTTHGRTWMWKLLQTCHIFSTSFIQGDPQASAFREGERNVGLRILTDVMKSDPQAYLLMTRENSE